MTKDVSNHIDHFACDLVRVFVGGNGNSFNY